MKRPVLELVTFSHWDRETVSTITGLREGSWTISLRYLPFLGFISSVVNWMTQMQLTKVTDEGPDDWSFNSRRGTLSKVSFWRAERHTEREPAVIFSGLRMRRIYSILPRLNGAVFKNCAVLLTRVFRRLSVRYRADRMESCVCLNRDKRVYVCVSYTKNPKVCVRLKHFTRRIALCPSTKRKK
jgi:hypothetical protein